MSAHIGWDQESAWEITDSLESCALPRGEEGQWDIFSLQEAKLMQPVGSSQLDGRGKKKRTPAVTVIGNDGS